MVKNFQEMAKESKRIVDLYADLMLGHVEKLDQLEIWIAAALQKVYLETKAECVQIALKSELPANPKSNIKEKNRTRKEIAKAIRNLKGKI